MFDATASNTEQQYVDYSLERYVGNTIRELRLKHELTIAEVAEQTGISRGMLSKIENAQTATSLDTTIGLLKLCVYFLQYDKEGSAYFVPTLIYIGKVYPTT